MSPHSCLTATLVVFTPPGKRYSSKRRMQSSGEPAGAEGMRRINRDRISPKAGPPAYDLGVSVLSCPVLSCPVLERERD